MLQELRVDPGPDEIFFLAYLHSMLLKDKRRCAIRTAFVSGFNHGMLYSCPHTEQSGALNVKQQHRNDQAVWIAPVEQEHSSVCIIHNVLLLFVS